MEETAISVEAILAKMKIEQLNEMQTTAIEAFGKTDNLVLLSDTGSGKTLAFLLPLIQSIDTADPRTQAMIVVPSRELALQIEQVYKSMGAGYKATLCYGGHLRETEENNLVEAPSLIIGTPGRIADHLRRQNIRTEGIHTLVLDEFDKSLELGFQDEVSFIVGELKSLKKRFLTSATPTADFPEFLGLKDPVIVDLLSGEKGEMLDIKQVVSDDKDKLNELFKLLCWIGERSSIIFCNHREAVQRTSEWLTDKGIRNVFYHGALEQPERESALFKFRSGTADFLVTTDLASRGLDINFIRYIIHYHLPASEEVYTHRNGRTARMDASGTAVLIVGPGEKIPSYVDGEIETIDLSGELIVPEKPKWTSLHIAAGKKNKVNKVDIVGFLSNRGQLKKEDIGLIEVKDYFSFVAVRRSKVSALMNLIKDHKIKNQKVRIDIAK